ncbi:CWF19-like protein 2 [Ylistrum balloti]|uniref:CWF19-like protein 2 n=1 Tax=Ylistrum balloti TaxID=509963 RepID=UPI002905C36D|nr:CWF19-like protein 2 [Ylistrum balloti]
MASFIPFESIRVKDAKREEKRKARAVVLENAKKDYEKAEWRKEQAKLRGEDKWMLPTIQQRLDKEEKEMGKFKKSKKHKKEKKKKKKVKKEKNRKKKDYSGSDSEQSSDSDNDADIWVEKQKDSNTSVEEKGIAVKGPQLQRDSWMDAPTDLIPLTSRQEIRERIKQDKEEKEKQKNLLDQPGQHALELNPYWKEGGTGLPETEKKKDKPSKVMGDGGLSWIRKSYDRCVQKAREENRTLEDVAAETHGSLEALQQTLAAAEKANKEMRKGQEENIRSSESRENYKKSRNSNNNGDPMMTSRKKTFWKPGNSDSEQTSTFHRRSRSKSNDRYKSRRRHSKSRSRSRSRERSRRSRSKSNGPYRSRRRHSESRSRSREKYRSRRSRSNSRERYRSRNLSRERHRSRSRDADRTMSRSNSNSRNRRSERSRSHERESREKNNLKKRFMRPGDSDEEVKTPPRSKFMRPSENDEESYNKSYSDKNSSRGDNYTPSWKKKEFMKPKECDKVLSKMSDSKPSNDKQQRSSSVSSTSSESSASSESESDQEEAITKKPVIKQEIKILTEQEMNQLGAKLVKAELMGNEAMASKIKAQMEASRKLKEEYKDRPQPSVEMEEEGEEGDSDVVLTRTGRDGMVRPLPDSQHPKEHGKRRRKKEKVDTHDKTGGRQRYFDDDDKFDLNTLVRREKMGTAEDQNSMFARLAGRAVEKTDDEYQLDDMFMSRASKKQSDSRTEERERTLAIGEHRKMAAAMERCEFCFGSVPKHLIIAIGKKVYLCMPNHRSLTEGHCLVVPMQHVTSSTAMDEDVWNEVQLFRKTLTKLFENMDMDVVFMETSMGLKYFPHMHLECVPMPRETGDLAPIYFKKAIQESETEWSQNIKVVDLSQKNIRRAIPKGFPFFSVDFGLQGGFAHVIEDENVFPKYFGKEIIGGMLDVEPRIWRKNQKENFDDQRKKVLQFSEWWKPYDWTQNDDD